MKKYILIIAMLILSICSYAESHNAEGETIQKFLQNKETIGKSLVISNHFNN